jgi:hypothetical protein
MKAIIESTLLMLVFVSLLFESFAQVALAAIEHYGWPRLDEVYMKVISNPDAAATAFRARSKDDPFVSGVSRA